MVKENLVCPICGQPTRVYMGKARKDRLCGKHADWLKSGRLIGDEFGTYIDNETDEVFITDEEQKKRDEEYWASFSEKCVVCGSPTRKEYKQCWDCFCETKDYMNGLDNKTVREFRTYYYNLKDYIFREKNVERAKTNCNKLIAIALSNNSANDDSALLDRVYKDVKDVLEKKLKQVEDKEAEQKSETVETDDKNKETQAHLLCSADGHALDSDMEIRIDDILYSNEIFHCCHKPVTDITERSVRSDWFIPVDSINKGIYIEYWGMDTPKYKQNKQEKIDLYKKHDLPLVEIQKDEPKHDTQTFTGRLIMEIQKKAEEYFGAMPKWAKVKKK